MSKTDYPNYGLKRNPFPPAAAGVPPAGTEPAHWPASLLKATDQRLEYLVNSKGPKAVLVVGGYGAGKTSFLRGILEPWLTKKKILPFYFENPGTQLYDLANTLMRTVGRYEFAKAIWEYLNQRIREKPKTLFPDTFAGYLQDLNGSARERDKEKRRMQQALRKLHVVDDEEVAMRFAELVVETASKPYFEYREFLVGTKGTLVAEGQESKYFKTLLQLLREIYAPDGIAFIIDEFEDVAIGHRMSRSKSYEYLATLRSLIDASEEEQLWLIIAMTPQALEQSREKNPALMQRFSPDKSIELEPWPLTDCEQLAEYWIQRERLDNYKSEGIFPFERDALEVLNKRPEFRNPRQLIKLLYLCIEEARSRQIGPPISGTLVVEVAQKIEDNESRSLVDSAGMQDSRGRMP